MSKNVNNDVSKDPPIPFYSCQLLGDLAYQCSEARGDLTLIQTSLLLLALESLDLHNKSSKLWSTRQMGERSMICTRLTLFILALASERALIATLLFQALYTI